MISSVTDWIEAATSIDDLNRVFVEPAAQAIAELCLIAGCPERAAEHIAAGRSESEVRRALCAARAARSEQTPIHSTLASEAGTEDGVRPETSPIVTAVKKLVHQE